MRYLVLIAAVLCCAIAQADDAPKPETASVADLNAATAQAECCPKCRPTPVRTAIAKLKGHCQPKCCPEPCPEPKCEPKPEPCCVSDPCSRPRLLHRIKTKVRARRCCPKPCG